MLQDMFLHTRKIMGYRSEEKCMPGFNMVILDVDEGISLSTAQMLLKDYKAMFYTTKRHTPSHNRFRIILPISHKLNLNAQAFKVFMENIYSWLPFEVDNQTNQRSRKWESCNGEYFYQDGQLLDAMLFVPETKKQEEQQQKIVDMANLGNLERWFLLNIGVGNRSNTLFRYACVLVDSGYSFNAIKDSIKAFNDKLKNPLSEEELQSTIYISVMKKISER